MTPLPRVLLTGASGALGYAGHEPVRLLADTSLAQNKLNWQPKLKLVYSEWELSQAVYPTL